MKKMKFNWGTGILVTILLFLSGVVGFFIYSSSLDINLVEENYYEKELAYQEKIDRIRNTESLPEQLQVELADKVLHIRFPEQFRGKKPEGHVLIYRPSDPAKDVYVPLQIDDSASQSIDALGLDPGRYIIKIDWTLDDIGYYYEEAVFNE